MLSERLKGRKGHFFPPSLLDSQLATLEPLAPEEPAIRVSIELPVEQQVAEIVAASAAKTDHRGGRIVIWNDLPADRICESMAESTVLRR